MSTLFERTAGGLQVRGKQDMEIKRLNRLLPNFLPAVKLGLPSPWEASCASLSRGRS